jgi:hypothetical protein
MKKLASFAVTILLATSVYAQQTQPTPPQTAAQAAAAKAAAERAAARKVAQAKDAAAKSTPEAAAKGMKPGTGSLRSGDSSSVPRVQH